MIWIYRGIFLVQAILVIRVILMAAKKDAANSFTRQLSQKVDFILTPVRKILTPGKEGIDFSPILIFLVLEVVKQLYFTAFF